MSTLLKQSTAVDIGIGPFLDDTDGKTAETALTITQPDIQLKKNGGAFAQKNAAQTLVHEVSGWYEVALDTTDTNTLGELIVEIHEAGALPCWRVFQVVPANVYDALVGGTDALQVHANEITAGLITAAAIATGAIDADALAADTITAAKIATGAISAAKFAAGAIDAAAIATGAIDADAIAADAVNKINQAVSGTADAGGSTTTIVDAERTEADADYWKGSVVLITSGAAVGQVRRISAFSAAADTITVSPAFTQSIATGVTYIILRNAVAEILVDAIKADAITAASIATGAIDADAIADNAIDAGAFAADAITAAKLHADVTTELQAGLATAAALATVQADTDNIQTRLPAALVGGRMDSDVAVIQANVVTASALAADAAAEIADAVWDEAAAGHVAAGSFGEQCGTDIDAILVDTGTTLQAEVDGIQADTENIQTRLPAALVGGRMDSDVAVIQANAVSASALATDAVTEIQAGLALSTQVDALEAAVIAIQADTDDIQTRLPAALVSGRIDASVGAMAADVLTAAALAADAANEFADALLKRDLDQVEATAAIHSFCSAALKLVSRFKATTGETYRTNGTTVHMTQTPVNDAVTAISELGVGV